MFTTAERTALAAQLHAYVDAIADGRAQPPAMRDHELDGRRLRVVPRVLHDVLCEVRMATPQEGSDPLVSHCAFCGLSYPRATVDDPRPTAASPR